MQYCCAICTEVIVVPIGATDSVFWDFYNGQAVLRMIAHYFDAHAILTSPEDN